MSREGGTELGWIVTINGNSVISRDNGSSFGRELNCYQSWLNPCKGRIGLRGW